MSTHPQTCYTIICDGCREQTFEGEEGCEYHFHDPESARREAQQYGDWSADGDRDLCPSCTCAHAGHRQKIGGSGFVYCERCDETLLDSITVEPKAAFL